ncbi:hypothetical protein AW111_20570 [Escherichia coli]|nr:hypothetical protein AW061_21080 [Escherichia coli]OTE21044.1 hypothetical protein AW111_20570 [Escherichia coli]
MIARHLLTTTHIRDYILRTVELTVGIRTPDRNRDRDTPRACFLLSYARAHLNYGGAYRGAEKLAGWFPGSSNPVRLTTR